MKVPKWSGVQALSTPRYTVFWTATKWSQSGSWPINMSLSMVSATLLLGGWLSFSWQPPHPVINQLRQQRARCVGVVGFKSPVTSFFWLCCIVKKPLPCLSHIVFFVSDNGLFYWLNVLSIRFFVLIDNVQLAPSWNKKFYSSPTSIIYSCSPR